MAAVRKQPVVLVIGGPNGAGKTTLALSALVDKYHITSFVNSDLIAQGLSPLAPEKASLTAGRLVLQEVRRLSGTMTNFADEWRIYDNTDLNPILAGSGAYDRITQVDVPFVWESIEQAARMS